MRFTRRQILAGGVPPLAGLGLLTTLPRWAVAQAAPVAELTGDEYPTANGKVVIHPVSHASFVMSVPGVVIYNDPIGGADPYKGLPPPDVILVGHEHQDHFDPPTLQAIAGENTVLITSQSIFDKLPDGLKGKAKVLANGATTVGRGLTIEAIPAYNVTPDREKFHPKGRDNGYLLSVDGKRIYIAGDTEDTPEMKALTGIDIAFLPMNLPYTMDEEHAAAAVAAFKPAVVYPYHYRGSDLDKFEAAVKQQAPGTRVVRGAWYS